MFTSEKKVRKKSKAQHRNDVFREIPKNRPVFFAECHCKFTTYFLELQAQSEVEPLRYRGESPPLASPQSPEKFTPDHGFPFMHSDSFGQIRRASYFGNELETCKAEPGAYHCGMNLTHTEQEHPAEAHPLKVPVWIIAVCALVQTVILLLAMAGFGRALEEGQQKDRQAKQEIRKLTGTVSPLSR